MEASYRLHKNFRDTQVQLAQRGLAIYRPTPLPATPTPLCILNLAFHTNAFILT
jgi:hypothetical protein